MGVDCGVEKREDPPESVRVLSAGASSFSDGDTDGGADRTVLESFDLS